MISNTYIKRLIQNNIFVLFSFINKKIKHDDKIIMLYSNMGFRDNIKSLYDYLIENKYNKQYKIICACNDYKKYYKNHIPNVQFISCAKGIIEYFSAGYVFYCFGKIPIEPGVKQKTIQLWHGSPYKAADKGMLQGHSWKHQYYTYSVAASKPFAKIWSQYFSMPLDHVLICGAPRNDVLFKSWPQYNFGSYEKIILWAPTFRYSKSLGYHDIKSTQIVPIININQFSEINEFLKKKNIKVVIKLHPLQDLDKYEITEMSNFILLSHNEFVERDMDLYKFMTQCDALITDYSSIFYDFLLLDRPIAFTEDDLDDYSSARGFAVDNPQMYKPGHRIRDIEDFYIFINDLCSNIDKYKEDRKRVNSLANEFYNGNFSQRILELVGITK